MIIYKVYFRKYTKDEPKLIGSERVNEDGNWECNFLGKPEWNAGVISINPSEGKLSRKEFVTVDVNGEFLFEGDKFTVSTNTEDQIFTLAKQSDFKTTYGQGDSSTAKMEGYNLGWGYGTNEYTIKLYNE